MSDPITGAITPAVETGNVATEATTQTTEVGKWAEQLSPEYRTDESLKGKAKLDDLYKDFKSRGEKLAELESKVKTFESPKDAKEYDLPKDLIDQLKLPEEVQAFYKESFLKSGLTKDQAGKIFSELTNRSLSFQKAQIEAIQKRDQANVEAIQKDWGQDYKANVETVSTAVEKLFGDATKMPEFQSLMKNPAFLKGLLPVGRAVSEGKFVKTTGSSEAPKGQNPEERLNQMYPTMQKKSAS